MRTLITIALFLFASAAFGQTSFLKSAVERMDKALIQKDTTALKGLLHQQGTFGHSNGWVQTKAEVVADLASGKLSYKTINHKDQRWTTAKDWASLWSKTDVTYVLDGKEGSLSLQVLQVWLKTGKGWQLIARQSTKLN